MSTEKSRASVVAGGKPSKTSDVKSRRSTKDEPTVEMREVVAIVREGDGVDPREEAKRKRGARRLASTGLDRGVHRQERFAAQIREAIDSALQLAAEPRLNALAVQEVIPQGGSLLVVAGPRDASVPLDVGAASRALRKAAAMLTQEVARAITRKQIPHLVYTVLPAGAARVES